MTNNCGNHQPESWHVKRSQKHLMTLVFLVILLVPIQCTCICMYRTYMCSLCASHNEKRLQCCHIWVSLGNRKVNRRKYKLQSEDNSGPNNTSRHVNSLRTAHSVTASLVNYPNCGFKRPIRNQNTS